MMGDLMSAMTTAAPATPQPDWLGFVLAALALAVGSGGIGALLKVRHDKRIGISQQELAEDDAISARWRSMIETQTRSLLEPMQTRLADVEVEVKTLKTELATTRRKYWGAVAYIRTLLTWINRNIDHEAEQHAPIPDPPATLAEDI